eukprot:EG_transcript_43310
MTTFLIISQNVAFWWKEKVEIHQVRGLLPLELNCQVLQHPIMQYICMFNASAHGVKNTHKILALIKNQEHTEIRKLQTQFAASNRIRSGWGKKGSGGRTG